MSRRMAIAACLLLATLACDGPRTDGDHDERSDARRGTDGAPAGRVLLLALDGADWRIIDRLAAEGRLPNLSRLRREGGSGVLLSEPPLLSPIVWTTMATGRPPLEHGVIGFLTVRDGRTEPVRSDERRVRAFWNVLSERGVSVGVIGWYATWPAERVDGFMVSDRIGTHQVAGAAARTDAALAYPPELQGEIEPIRRRIDEAAPSLVEARFVPASCAAAPRMKTFLDIVETTELYRDLTPRLMRRFGTDVTAVYLEGTDAVGHLFAEYAPPALAGADPELARCFADVFDRYYEYTDEVVGEIIDGIDPRETTVIVVSDHGFKTGELRPSTPSHDDHGDQAPLWHRPEGIVMLWGRGVRPGVELAPVTLYDVAPTIFRLVGVPLSGRLRGRSIESALTDEVLSQPVSSVEDYETAGAPHAAPAGAELPSGEALERLRSLGYVGSADPGADGGVPNAPSEGQAAIAMNRYNLGIVLLQAGEDDRALDVFRELQRSRPRQALGFLGEGVVMIRRGRPDAALPVLERARDLGSGFAPVHAALGEAYGASGRVEQAQAALRTALRLDAADGRTALLLGQLELGRGQFESAAAHLETALARAPRDVDRAAASVGLAVLAEEAGDLELAARRYEAALELRPDFPPALERLGNLELFRGRVERGVELLERLVRVTGGREPRVLTRYGRALLLAGREADAVRALETAAGRGDREAADLLRSLDGTAP